MPKQKSSRSTEPAQLDQGRNRRCCTMLLYCMLSIYCRFKEAIKFTLMFDLHL